VDATASPPATACLCELIANGLRRHAAERISIAELREGFRELGPALAKFPWPLRAA
jgi:hypothetical protein